MDGTKVVVRRDPVITGGLGQKTTFEEGTSEMRGEISQKLVPGER
jgi:hypothetical protein